MRSDISYTVCCLIFEASEKRDGCVQLRHCWTLLLLLFLLLLRNIIIIIVLRVSSAVAKRFTRYLVNNGEQNSGTMIRSMIGLNIEKTTSLP